MTKRSWDYKQKIIADCKEMGYKKGCKIQQVHPSQVYRWARLAKKAAKEKIEKGLEQKVKAEFGPYEIVAQKSSIKFCFNCGQDLALK